MFPSSFVCPAVSTPLRLPLFLVLLLAVTLAGCGSSATGPGTTTDQTPEGLFGKWFYVGGTLWTSDTSMKALANVDGDLELKRDMTWSHSRYIDVVTAFGEGNFTVKGDTITLKHNDASGDLVYTYFVGSEPDPAGGTRKTLGLTSMRRPGEDWFAFVLRENKE